MNTAVPSQALPRMAGVATAATGPTVAWDDPAEWQSFSAPVAGAEGAWESCVAVLGMHCAACAMTVEQLLMPVPGVASVQVSGAGALARLVWRPALGQPSAWLQALRGSGYSLLPAGDPQVLQQRLRERRLLLWRWLVAGFCMMQVMMYAYPAYSAASGEITPDMQALLRWASWVLTLPVILFSCAPFFQAAWRDLRAGRVGMDVPVALGLAMAFAASSAATFDPSGPWGAEVWFDSVTMFVFFLLSGRLLEARLRARSAGALEAQLQRMPHSVERQRADGSFERVAVRRVTVGDTLRVAPGEVIAADGVILRGNTSVDEAMLTGESLPLPRSIGDAVIAGSNNLDGLLLLRVERTGAETRHAALAALMQQAATEKPRLAQLADRIATPFLLLVLCASAFAAWWWWEAGPAQAISAALAVLIVTCPCALSLATPAATLAAAGALARRGVLVRHLQVLETCAVVDTVLLDKTGTLTGDTMQVVDVLLRPGASRTQALAMAAALAQHSQHPASQAITRSAGAAAWDAGDVQAVPGQGLQGQVAAQAGATAQALWLGSAQLCHAPATPPEATQSRVHLADEQGWLASFVLDEVLRNGSFEAVHALQGLHLNVGLLSGDEPAAVARIAASAGIARAQAACSPEAKLAQVRELQVQGRCIAMVGDGMNDAAVLARANVAIAMGQGAQMAKGQADVVLLGNDLRGVPLLLRQARRTRWVVRQNLAWAAGYNLVCVPLAVLGQMPPWLAGLGMATSSLLVVLNAARLARLPGEA